MVRAVANVLLWCCLIWGQTPDPAAERALAAHKAGEWNKAEAAYRDFLKRHPQAFEIRSNLGAVLVGQGRYSEAIREYTLALKDAGSNPGIALNLALAHYKAGNIAEAAQRLESLHKTKPQNHQTILLLADSWLQMGENTKIIELLTPVASARPDDLAVAYLLGGALIRDKRVTEGQVFLDKILRNGDSAEARFLMGTAKFAAADLAGARDDFEAAVKINPKLPSANGWLGMALMATGDAGGAVQAFRAELTQNSNNFESNLSLAVVLKQDQELEQAKMHLERALRIRPGDVRVRYQQATIDLAEGRIDDARRTLEVVVKQAPEFVEAHVSLATAYYRLKRKAEGDRERAIVEKLNAEIQARQPKPVASKPANQ